jgi:hypothetical protein
MESGELVAFDDRLLRPRGDALTTLVDSMADIQARRPTPDRFASETDAVRFDVMRRQLQRMISADGSTEERRLHVRIPCDLWVRVSHRGQVRPGVIDDLGSGGVFVSTLLDAPIGDRVQVFIAPQEDVLEEPLALEARVAWLGTRRRTGFGAAFVEDGDEARRSIDRLVLLLLQSSYPVAWRRRS